MSYITHGLENSFHDKLACFDLEHTLIEPLHNASEDFDLKFKADVIPTLRLLRNNDWSIVVFTNAKTRDALDTKQWANVCQSIEDTLGFPITILISLQDDACRKPLTGLWEVFELFYDTCTEVFYCGEPFVNHNIYFARNVGIPFVPCDKVFRNKKISHASNTLRLERMRL